MMQSVKITTPIPSLEEFADRLGLRAARQRSLSRIATSPSSKKIDGKKIVAKKVVAKRASA